MKRLSLFAALALSLASCGGGEPESAIVKVQVLDVDGTILGSVPVIAELRTRAQAGATAEVIDSKEASTDGEGFAYLELMQAQEYRVSARLELPNERGCAWVASTWVNTTRPDTKMKLSEKICS